MGLLVNGKDRVCTRTTCPNARVIVVGGLADWDIGHYSSAFRFIDEFRVPSALRPLTAQEAPYSPDDATVTLHHLHETDNDWPSDAADP